MNCFSWVLMGHFRPGVVDDDSIAWEEEKSRTVALKQLQLFSISWGPKKKVASWQTAGLSLPKRAEPIPGGKWSRG